MTRRNFYYEYRQMVLWSVLAGAIEGRFPAVVAANTFAGSPLQIAVATSTQTAAMITSLLWGMLCIGRPKVRLLMLFCGATALLVGGLGAVPNDPRFVWWFLAQMAAAQVMLAAVITIRTAVWKSNYPRSDRGRITARLQAARTVTGVTTTLLAGALCDHYPSFYRLFFPAIALSGMLSIAALSRLRIRGEKSELKRRGVTQAREVGQGPMVEPFSITALLSPGRILAQVVRIFRDDARFRWYIVAQLLVGLSNLMTLPIAVVLITQYLPAMGRGQPGGSGGAAAEGDFWLSTVLTVGLMQLTLLLTLSHWGRLFDRVGVIRMRVVNCGCWAVSTVAGLAGNLMILTYSGTNAWWPTWAVVVFAFWAVTQGLALGGGALAWNLGHLHFAHPRDAEVYMGIHVSLTGLRGLIGGVLGIRLWEWMGWSAWLVGLAFALGSLAMFAWMAGRERAGGGPDAASGC